jgi:hypothetical protein
VARSVEGGESSLARRSGTRTPRRRSAVSKKIAARIFACRILLHFAPDEKECAPILAEGSTAQKAYQRRIDPKGRHQL